MTESRCCCCGILLPNTGGATHRYMRSSPACSAAYGEISARTYQEPQRIDVLLILVDAYAVQHPGLPGRREAQSIGIHLMTLCLVVERGAEVCLS